MCGRFTLTVEAGVVQQAFDLTSVPAVKPRYNIAPTQAVLAVVNNGERHGEFLHWGLIPSWAKEASIGSRMINARSETLAEKLSFRAAYRKRRCVIFADGFYEWKKDGSHKTPIYIRLNNGAPFAMAGLWEVWQPPGSEDWLRSCTIVTTDANAFVAGLHSRMPVILDREAMDFWLTPGDMAPDALAPLLKPYENEAVMSAYAVSKVVNSPANDSPECILPFSASHEGGDQPALF